MKLSELIKRLQEIERTVPFNSEVVTGDDWMPQEVKAVYHEPPYTYIQFDDQVEDDEDELSGVMDEATENWRNLHSE